MPLSTREAYPNGSDLAEWLAGGGIVLNAAQSPLADGFVRAAIADFEQRAGRKMLAEGDADEERRFDPPTNGGTLFIDDAVSVATVGYYPLGGSLTAYTLNTDYRLSPANAPAMGKPYTQIQFGGRRWGCYLSPQDEQSILVTGLWGYGTTLPEDVWAAMLAGAASIMAGQIRQAATGGIQSFTDGDRQVSYGVETWSNGVKAWNDQVAMTVALYRRLSL